MREIISSLLGMPVELSVESEAVSKPKPQANAPSQKRETPKNENPPSPPSRAEDFTIEPTYPNTPIRDRREPHLSNLQPRYTFESFVVGENNNFAFNAATAVSEKPGVAYNPLLIYGGVGLGKTHLMHAIGNRIMEMHPELRIICVTAENFTNEFIKTIHDRTTNDFKNRYRNVDVLLIDDIHFFQSKHGVQEELFHTFNALYDSNKQLVFTCDRPASELKDFSERLKSRFMMGLKTDLTTPGFETRAAIIRKKLELYRRSFSEDVINLIAKSIETNVRDLDSCINQIIAYADLIKVEPKIGRAHV
jgi:chromosomal replication initiator protein